MYEKLGKNVMQVHTKKLLCEATVPKGIVIAMAEMPYGLIITVPTCKNKKQN
jgi:hypothetical protein